ncbi:MAG TPA: RteC domain-containing protein [Chitinophagaceae bacterium]|jgi:hypothetical protein|nr:RteC domain-containing protein [Chitinophagaceae bacterium]
MHPAHQPSNNRFAGPIEGTGTNGFDVEAAASPFFLQIPGWVTPPASQVSSEPFLSCKSLYTELVAALVQTWDQPGSRRDIAEDCFRISMNYWDLLKKHYASLFFRSTGEEVLFFRYVKPGFLAFAQMFSLVYHVVLFRPQDPVAGHSFLEAESLRYPNFLAANKALIDYWLSDATVNDQDWFLRHTHHSHTGNRDAFDRDPLFHTAKDQPVRSYLALRAYHHYIAEQLAQGL